MVGFFYISGVILVWCPTSKLSVRGTATWKFCLKRVRVIENMPDLCGNFLLISNLDIVSAKVSEIVSGRKMNPNVGTLAVST